MSKREDENDNLEQGEGCMDRNKASDPRQEDQTDETPLLLLEGSKGIENNQKAKDGEEEKAGLDEQIKKITEEEEDLNSDSDLDDNFEKISGWHHGGEGPGTHTVICEDPQN